MGGAAGKIADVGIKSLAAFGGIGLQATAAVGAVLMLYNAYEQYADKQRAVSAGATELANVNAQLGGSYDAVRLAAAQDGTAEERVNAIRAAGLAVLQQRIALDQQGFNRTQSDSFAASIDNLRSTYAALGDVARRGTAEMVQQAIQSGNAAVQQRLLGLSFEHSTDATIEHANQTRALSVVLGRAAADEANRRIGLRRTADATVAAARESVAALSDQAAAGAAGDRVTRDLNKALADQARLTVQVASGTARATAMQQAAAVATRELAAAADAANEEGKRHAQQQVSDAAKERQRAAARAASSPQELRAQAEALRLAREANDNAGRTITFEQQMESLRLRLAFATREVAIAEASRHDHTRRLTAALQAQTEVLNAQRAAADAQLESYRPLREVILALTSAEGQRLQVSLDADKVDTAKIRNGEILLRQETLAATVRQRAREDAVAAAAAFAGGGETAAERAGISTGESARAALATAEADATRELARATQDLAQARREESDASISTEDRTTHVTEALARQTTALQRQRAAQAASNAEIQRIRTDRVDALTGAAKGLGDGLVSAGLAAAFAGENIGAALQKQLAASLQALAIESAQKALFALATGFFYLATYNPAAVPAFTSAAIFGAVAVGAGAVSAAIAPSAAPAAAGGGAGERASGVSPGGGGGMGGGSSAGPTVNNYYAPIVGGRQSTDAETGVRIDRYNDAARARLRRAA